MQILELEDDGFSFQDSSGKEKIKWTDIKRLVAYKRDLFTFDEICLDIVYDNKQRTITEETPGWEQFIERLKAVFPNIPENWDADIVQPAFATNLSILYEQGDAGYDNGE